MITKLFVWAYIGVSLYSSYIYYSEGHIGKCLKEELFVDSVVRGFFIMPPKIVLNNIKYNLNIIYNIIFR